MPWLGALQPACPGNVLLLWGCSSKCLPSRQVKLRVAGRRANAVVAAHGYSAGKHNHKSERPSSSAYVCLPQLACICAAPGLRNSLRAGVSDKSEQPAKTTRIRVERQTHLPATCEEAWAALRQLVPPREWQEASGVFAALESIYRSAQHCLGPLLALTAPPSAWPEERS